MCLKIQQKINQAFAKSFANWGRCVARCPCLILTIALTVFLFIASGMQNYKQFEDEQVIWTPENNPSLLNRDRKDLLFAANDEVKVEDNDKDSRIMAFLFEAKQLNETSPANLLTKEVFEEYIRFDEMLYTVGVRTDANITENEDGTPYVPVGDFFYFKDVCKLYNITSEETEEELFKDADEDDKPVEISEKCYSSKRPIDFIYERQDDVYNLTAYEDDVELLDKIQSGKGDPLLYPMFVNIYVDAVFGGTVPEELEQDPLTGENDLATAKASIFFYFMDGERNPTFNDKIIDAFEQELQRRIEEFSVNSEHFTVVAFTTSGIKSAFQSDIEDDLFFIIVAQMLVGVYTILFLGNCSPIHFRSSLALQGLLTILLSYFAGQAVCFSLGQEVAGVHNLLPFLLIGIGVDDMFVIVNAIDQTDNTKSVRHRIIEGIMHAGPSITITSFTDALAFFFGSTTSLIALRSFCYFAGTCCIMLYLCVLTIFCPLLVFDLRRQHAMKGDCCRLCCCKEDSIICCRGYFLTDKQRKFSGLAPRASKEISQKEKDLGSQGQNAQMELELGQKEGGQPDIVEQVEVKETNGEKATIDKSDQEKGAIPDADSQKGSAGVAEANDDQQDKVSQSTADTKVVKEEEEYEWPSATEKFLSTVVAPELLSTQGRVSILVIYFVMITASIYGSMQVQIDFSIRYFITDRAYVSKYFDLNDKYFQSGFTTTIYVDNANLDYASVDTQKQIIQFEDYLYRCKGCQETWTEPNQLDSWYFTYHQWVKNGECTVQREGLNEFEKIINPTNFYFCLEEFLATDRGDKFEEDILFTAATDEVDRVIKGYRIKMGIKKIESAAREGVMYLDDMNTLLDTYGLPGSYSYAQEYLDFEQYVVFLPETLLSCGLSIVAVFVVIIFITGSLTGTMLVVMCVLLVDVFLLGLIHFWNLTFNSIVVVQLVIAIGLAVDYSAHIAHAYLVATPPASCVTVSEKRVYKAQKALSGMGSSVFHGAFSTFLAIIVLAPSKSYIFIVFFRMWFGMIIFGVSNGFLLLPVILATFGPTDNMVDHSAIDIGEEPEEKEGKSRGCCTKKKNQSLPLPYQEKEVEMVGKQVVDQDGGSERKPVMKWAATESKDITQKEGDEPEFNQINEGGERQSEEPVGDGVRFEHQN